MEGEIGVDRMAGCMALSDFKTTFYRQQMDGPYELQSDWVGWAAFLIHSIELPHSKWTGHMSHNLTGLYVPYHDLSGWNYR